jgi:hypothetical protein
VLDYLKTNATDAAGHAALMDDIADRIDALRKQDGVKDREAKQKEKADRIAALQRQLAEVQEQE